MLDYRYELVVPNAYVTENNFEYVRCCWMMAMKLWLNWNWSTECRLECSDWRIAVSDPRLMLLDLRTEKNVFEWSRTTIESRSVLFSSLLCPSSESSMRNLPGWLGNAGVENPRRDMDIVTPNVKLSSEPDPSLLFFLSTKSLDGKTIVLRSHLSILIVPLLLKYHLACRHTPNDDA